MPKLRLQDSHRPGPQETLEINPRRDPATGVRRVRLHHEGQRELSSPREGSPQQGIWSKHNKVNNPRINTFDDYIN